MPRNVRNFWLTLDVDGKKQRIATGPQRADGGFNLNIKMRAEGEIWDTEFSVEGEVIEDEGGPYLRLAFFEDTNEVYSISNYRNKRKETD